jgi:hypothetical protein
LNLISELIIGGRRLIILDLLQPVQNNAEKRTVFHKPRKLILSHWHLASFTGS